MRWSCYISIICLWRAVRNINHCTLSQSLFWHFLYIISFKFDHCYNPVRRYYYCSLKMMYSLKKWCFDTLNLMSIHTNSTLSFTVATWGGNLISPMWQRWRQRLRDYVPFNQDHPERVISARVWRKTFGPHSIRFLFRDSLP